MSYLWLPTVVAAMGVRKFHVKTGESARLSKMGTSLEHADNKLIAYRGFTADMPRAAGLEWKFDRDRGP